MLHERGELDNLEFVVGSSAGAIVAAALACHANPAFLKAKLMETNFAEFCDDDFGIVRDVHRLFTRYGWYKGDRLAKWVGDALEDLTGHVDVTFAQIKQWYGRYLEITVTDVNSGATLYLNPDTAPNMLVKKAVRRSAMIPLFFQADCEKDALTKVMHYYVDGGFMHNYPIDRLYLHLPPDQCVGLKLLSSKELHEMKNPYLRDREAPPPNLLEYMKCIFVMLRNQALRSHVHKADWARTIRIDVEDVSAVDFELSRAQIDKLIANGRAAAEAFFDTVVGSRSRISQ